MKSSIATATTRARSGPLPIVCLQVTERAPTATAEELELSNVIAADAGDAAQNSRRRRKNPVASRFNGFTRGILLLGVVVFMTDSFSLTRNQGLFSASGKFRKNEAVKSADCSADQRHAKEKARRKSGIQNFLMLTDFVARLPEGRNVFSHE
jgi:hypothetical protein